MAGKGYVYVPSSPPVGASPEMLSWLRREFQAVRRGLTSELGQDAVLGSMGTSVGQTIGDLGNSTWQDITQYIDVRNEVGVILDPVAGTFQFAESGAYILVFEANLVHNEAQGARHFFLRAADNSARTTASIEVFTARNVEGSAMGVTAVVNAAAGDTWKFQIGGTDDVYTSCEFSYKSMIIFSK